MTEANLPVNFDAVKIFVAFLLVIGLLSPMCLCGAVVTGSHGVAVCDDTHGHSHGDQGGVPVQDSEHQHAHSDFRMMAASAVSLPTVPSTDLAEWLVDLRERSTLSRENFFGDRELSNEAVAHRSRRAAPAVTGVFRI